MLKENEIVFNTISETRNQMAVALPCNTFERILVTIFSNKHRSHLEHFFLFLWAKVKHFTI